MDANSFRQKCLPFHPKLFRIAVALVENRQDAEDILQEAYCKLWEKRDELEDVRNMEAFCVTLLKNLCLDFLRSPKACRYENTIETVTLSIMEPSPDKVLENRDEIQCLKQLIDRLPENQKQVIRLRGLSDCSMEEIEEITGFSSVNVRTLLSRARKIIREEYKKLYTV